MACSWQQSLNSQNIVQHLDTKSLLTALCGALKNIFLELFLRKNYMILTVDFLQSIISIFTILCKWIYFKSGRDHYLLYQNNSSVFAGYFQPLRNLSIQYWPKSCLKKIILFFLFLCLLGNYCILT